MGPDSGSVEPRPHAAPDPNDPLFRGEEPSERAGKKATLLFQFFLFPLLIVVAAVGVFLFFGLIGGSRKSMDEYLDAVIAGGPSAGQASQQLALLLSEESRRAHDPNASDRRAPEYMRPEFRRKLETAFRQSFESTQTTERRVFLVTAMGLVGAPEFLAPLEARLTQAPGQDPLDDFPTIRQSVAWAIARIDSPEAVPVLARLSRDEDEAVANFGVQGLDRWNTPEATAALEKAAGGGSENVRDSAVLALSRRGNATGSDRLAALLDPEEVERRVRRPAPPGSSGGPNLSESVRAGVLVSAIHGALALKDPALKPRVEALAKDRDGVVREAARDAIDRWK